MNRFWPALYARPVELADLREQLTPERANRAMRDFEKTFPLVREWARTCTQDAPRQPWGRRRQMNTGTTAPTVKQSSVDIPKSAKLCPSCYFRAENTCPGRWENTCDSWASEQRGTQKKR